jgi:hypothetical protein
MITTQGGEYLFNGGAFYQIYFWVIFGTYSNQANTANATLSTICLGSSTTLGLTGGNLGVGANWYWYSGTCGGIYEGIGTTLTVSPTASTTYYVRAEGGCNTTSCVNATVTVNGSVSAASAAATPPAICLGSSTSLGITGGSLQSGANWHWYSGTCGAAAAGNGSTIIVSPTVTTTYYVRAEGTCNTTTCVTATVTVSTFSTAANLAYVITSPICPGSTTALSLTGGSLGTGTSWYWYRNSCGGIAEGTGSTITVAPTITTTYYVRAEGGCNTTTCVSAIVDVSALSTSVTTASASPLSICPGSSTTLSLLGGSLGTGANWYVYSGSCGGNLVSPPVSPTVTTTYYIRAEGTCNTTTCASVTVTVDTLSTQATSATASASPICPGTPTTLSVSGGSLGTGADWVWYSNACGSILEGTGAALIVTPTATTTYYVEAEGACNTTTCVSVTVAIITSSTPATSATANPSTIQQGFITTLSKVGGSLGAGANWYWYRNSCGDTLEGPNSIIMLAPTVTATYYVRAEGTCNTTSCASVTVIVLPLGIDNVTHSTIEIDYYEIFNVLGQYICSSRNKDFNAPNGVYIIKSYNKKTLISSKKIFVQPR